MRRNIHNIINAAICLCAILAGAPRAAAYDTTHYASVSRLADGHWVKVRVDHEGLYEVTYDQLREWGFSDPAKVCVYGFGGTALAKQEFGADDPDDLTEAVYFHRNDALRFYGVGGVRWIPKSYSEVYPEQNIYSDYGYYFLSDAEVARVPQNVPYTASDKEPKRAGVAIVSFMEDVANPIKAGGFFFGKEYAEGEKHTFEVPVSRFDDLAEDVASIHVNIRYAAAFGNGGACELGYDKDKFESTRLVAPNTGALYTSSERKYYLTTYEQSLMSITDDHSIADGTLTFTFGPSDRTGQLYYLADDYAAFSYPQIAAKEDGKATVISFVGAQSGDNFEVRNCDDGTEIYDVTRYLPQRLRYDVNYNVGTQTMTATFANSNSDSAYPYHTRLLVVNPSTDAADAPEYIGTVANQNIHGDVVPEMVIITTDELYNYAEELADAHRQNGTPVNVYTQKQVFNEFSSGAPDISAYRRVLKMFSDRDSATIKYLLLYGRAIWDHRQIVEKTGSEALLTYENASTMYAGNLSQAYVSDGVIGVLDDSFVAERLHAYQAAIAVGRIPADNASMAEDANAKVIGYINGNVPFDNFTRAVYVSDDGDGYTHLNQTEAIINQLELVRPEITPIRVHNDIFPWTGKDAKTARTVLSDALMRGAGLFYYIGHGTADGFTGEKLWTRSAVNSLTYKYPPFAHLSTCDSYAYDHRDNNIAEAMFFKREGGSIGVIGACRAVYMQMNQVLAVKVAEAYGSAIYGTTIGDIYLKGSNATKKLYSTDDYVCINTCCYNLLGDPAVRLPFPKNYATARVVKFNDEDVSSYQPVLSQRLRYENCRITPGKPFAIEAIVKGKHYNGRFDVTVYQSPREVPTLVQNPSDTSKPKNITIEQDVLAETSGTYTLSDMHASIIVPQPSYVGETNRIVASMALDEQPSAGYAAVFDVAYIDDDVAAVEPDYGNAPVINQLYIDTPDMREEDVVGKDFVIYAVITAPNGLNVSTDLGAATRLTMDHNKSYHDVVYNIAATDDPTVYMLSYPMSEVADGRHILTLDVADNTGARTSMDLAFSVMSSHTPMSLMSGSRVARQSNTFTVYSENGSDKVSGPYSILISDALGNTVLNKAVEMPYTWDLKDRDGKFVADGVYSARILSGDATGDTHGYSNKVTFTVIRKK